MSTAIKDNSNVTILHPETKIEVYNKFRSELAELVKTNSVTVFDYADPKGNKDARSYIFKLRKTKAAVDDARKKEKAASLEYGRRVDEQAKEIIVEVDAMIKVHQTAIDEIEENEKARVEAIKRRVANIALYQQCGGHDSKETAAAIANLEAIEIDDSFAEFKEEAAEARRMALAAQRKQHELALSQEQEKAENERLRLEVAAYQRKEHDEQIRREAEDKARLDAERRDNEHKLEMERAEKAKIEAIQRAEKAKADAEAREKAAKEQAERDRVAAIERGRLAKIEADKQAEKARLDAVAEEKARVQREADAKAAAEAKRQADQSHKQDVHAAIITALSAIGIDEVESSNIIEAITAGKVPHVAIQY